MSQSSDGRYEVQVSLITKLIRSKASCLQVLSASHIDFTVRYTTRKEALDLCVRLSPIAYIWVIDHQIKDDEPSIWCNF